MDSSIMGPEAPLLHYWNVLQKRRAVILGFAGTVILCVLVLSLLSPPTYRAIAMIELKLQAPVVMNEVTDIMDATNAASETRFRLTERWVMESRVVFGEAGRRLRDEHGVAEFQGVEDPFDLVSSHVYIDEMLSTNLIQVIGEHQDAELAALYANVAAESYRDQNRERAMQATDEALGWLAKQQELYRKKNFESEQSVEAYKAEHGLFALQNRTVSSDTLSELQTKWSTAHTERETVEADLGTYRHLIDEGKIMAVADHLSGFRPIIANSMSEFRALEHRRTSLRATLLEKHPEVRKVDTELAGVRAQIRDELNVYLSGKKAEARVLRNQETRLRAAIDTAYESMAAQGQAMIPLKFLTASADRDQHFYETLDERMAELALQQFIRGNNVRIVTPALVPKTPYKPQIGLNLLSAIFVGLLGGITVGIILDAIDTTVRSREDVESAAGAPMLGLVPLVDMHTPGLTIGERDGTIYSHAMPRSPLAECLRTVRTNIQFRWGQGEMRSMLITSASPKEGKSFISANLAVVMAANGKRTLLIDGDLRRPSLHKRFGLERDVGLTTVIQDGMPLADAVQRTTIPGVDLLTAGPNTASPSELLRTEAIEALLAEAGKYYDLTIIDSPPLNVVADPLVIASVVDSWVFVVQASKTAKHLVKNCCDRIREVNQKLLGTVVNKQDIMRAGYDYNYYYYDYYHYYSSAEERDTPRSKLESGNVA
jgi:capsular exopolysaccharide synthesis family protein